MFMAITFLIATSTILALSLGIVVIAWAVVAIASHTWGHVTGAVTVFKWKAAYDREQKLEAWNERFSEAATEEDI